MDTVTDPATWGVSTDYTDSGGSHRQVPDSTVAAVLGAMGAGPGGPPAGERFPLVVRLDRPPVPVPSGRLTTEDGAEERVGGRLPPDLPPGYHTFEADGSPPRPLIASPGRCPLPPGPRWGWAAQLYATRSRRSWGMGDLGDLAELARWSATLGAGMVLINPLHAAAPGPRQQASPYYPASRCFLNPLYLRVEDVPGAGDLPGMEAAAAAGVALNRERVIDRDRVWSAKLPVLESIYSSGHDGRGLERFARAGGGPLEKFATWCALAERHGLPWQSWPEGLRHPASPAVAEFAASPEGRRRIRFHQWLQWQLDRQLHAATTGGVGVVQDLAIGVDPGGADAWIWQDSLAGGVRVGAPPDQFNTQGQDWGLPPWDPWKLGAAGYRPFVETIRAGLRHAGGLRVDHVMGLFRLWWIPSGHPASAGAYVSYPAEDLLSVLALEASRAGAFVIGEDLGTVEPGVRERLAERQVLSYRLLWFESQPPRHWPVQALGTVTTHDLPTVAGTWSGSDLEAQRRLGLEPNEEGSAAIRRRLAEWTGAGDGAPVSEVVERTYRLLAESPATLLAATLDDLCCVEERPNMPGTTEGWPNWSLALPLTVEELRELPLAVAVAAVLGRQP